MQWNKFNQISVALNHNSDTQMACKGNLFQIPKIEMDYSNEF